MKYEWRQRHKNAYKHNEQIKQTHVYGVKKQLQLALERSAVFVDKSWEPGRAL